MKKKQFAFFQSVVCLVLCLSMFVSTTFAWFTDAAVSGGNIIASGVLDATMEYATDPNGQWTDASTGAIFNYEFWEPGYTDMKFIRVGNNGNLAFRYQLHIIPTDPAVEGEPNLADVIDVYCGVVEEGFVVPTDFSENMPGMTKIGTLSDLIGKADGTANGVLLPTDGADRVTLNPADEPIAKTGSSVLCIMLHMQEDAGNEYQNLTVGGTFRVQLNATQYTYENDSFGNDYDTDSEFSTEISENVSADVTVEDNKVKDDVTIQGSNASAQVPSGVQVSEGTDKLTLSISEKSASESNITLGENEALRALDVHMEGVAENNTVPMIITIAKAMAHGLNAGNYRLIHVENGMDVAMTPVASLAEVDAHNEFYYDPATGDVTMALATFSVVAFVADEVNAWNGEFNYDWYDASKDSFVIANADQLAGFGAIVGGMNGKAQDSFAGKTIKLISDVNLGDKNDASTHIFYPIGYYNEAKSYVKPTDGTKTAANVSPFEGTFDGAGHTIANFYQNTWQMWGDYDGNSYKAAMGLFGYVANGKVCNLTVDNFSSDGEFTPTGVIAAYAVNSSFENIAITNCNPRVYNTGNGGIVGIGGNSDDPDTYKLTFTNITIDNSNIISALWGSWDVACGGLVGMFRGAGHVYMTNCHVAAQIDVYNDVCGNYQYYWYRYAGMMVGTNKNMTTDTNGYTVPETDKFHAENCTVHFGEWNDYYYCELVANSLASYTHDHQFSRLTKVDALPDSAEGTAHYYVKNVDGTITCRHFINGELHKHEDSGTETVEGKNVLKEDKTCVYLPFNQLFTGYGWGVKHIPVYNGEDYAFAGITILDREVASSQDKFVAKFADDAATLEEGKTYKLSELFNSTDVGVQNDSVVVAVTDLNNTENPVTVDFQRDATNWKEGTISFTGQSRVKITIQDYNYCNPASVIVTIGSEEIIPTIARFAITFPNYETYLYRVGNLNAFNISNVFKLADGVEDTDIGNVAIEVKNASGDVMEVYAAGTGAWDSGTIDFADTFTGLVTVTISDDNNSAPVTLNLEVVEAKNYPSPTAGASLNATANNVVLLADCGFSTVEVSGGYSLYGNGFTMTCSSDSYAVDRSYGFVTLNNGTLDNVQIITPNFSHSILYDGNKKENGNPSYSNEDGTRTWYYNIRSAVTMSGNSKILNSYVHGGRAAVYAMSGNPVIENSTISGGAAANIHVEVNNNLTLRDVTLIQKPMQATVNTTANTVMGLSVVLVCDSAGVGAPVTLEGTLRQYAWAYEDYKQYVPSDGQTLVNEALGKTNFIHAITYEDGVTRDSVNLGFVYLPDTAVSTSYSTGMNDIRAEKVTVPYETVTVNGGRVSIYTYKNTNSTHEDVKTEPGYTPSNQDTTLPTVSFTDTNENRVFTTEYKDGWTSTLKVDVDAGNYSFSFDNLLVQKYGQNLAYTVANADGTSVDKSKTIEINSADTKEFVLTITDDLIYDEAGTLTGDKVTHTFKFMLLSTQTSIKPPEWKSKPVPSAAVCKHLTSGWSDWTLAIPVLKDAVITYWSNSAKQYVDLDLTTLTPGSKGKQNNGANEWSVTVDGEYTLKITSGEFKTNYLGMPVVYEESGAKTLYYTVNSSAGCLGSGTNARTVVITYNFTDGNNNVLANNTVTWTINKSDLPTKTVTYNNFVTGECVTADTMVMLSDGTQKRIDEVTYDDQLLVWNFFTGAYDVVPSAIIYYHGDACYRVLNLNFEDGTTVKVINNHGFFDMERNEFVFITEENVEDYIGDSFAKVDGENRTAVKLVSYDITEEYTGCYSIETVQYKNFMTEGMFSLTIPYYEGWFDYFEIGDNMKYDEEKMQADIEKYGLYTYEDFAEYVTYEQFIAFNGPYLKVLVGRGVVTYEQILFLIETVLNN